MRKTLLLVCAALLAFAAVGCGTSGGSDADDTTTTTKADAATTTTKADDDTTTTEADDDDDVDPTDVTGDEYIAAFVSGLTSGSREDGNLVLPQEAAECVAPLWLDAFTLEDLQAAGITVEDASDAGFDPADVGIDEQQALEVIDAFSSCDFDIYTELAMSLTVGLGSDVQECAAQNIDVTLADDLMVKAFSGGESDAEFDALLTQLQENCDIPDN